MSSPIREYRQNDLIILTYGEYSDYTIKGVFRASKDFNACEALKTWAAETNRPMQGDCATKGNGYDSEAASQFISWLNVKGYISDCDYRELYTGDYGGIRLEEGY